MVNDEYYMAALRTVNKILTERGKDPVYELSLGSPRSGRYCTISSTLRGSLGGDVSIYTGHAAIVLAGEVIELDDPTRDFIAKVDHFGEYPELKYPELNIDLSLRNETEQAGQHSTASELEVSQEATPCHDPTQSAPSGGITVAV